MPPRPACCRAVPARCRRRMRPKRGRPASPGAPVCARLGAGVARQERCGSDADGGNHQRATGTPSDLAGPRSGGAWRGRPLRVAGAGAGRAPGAVVGGHRGAEAEGADKRLRLPHAHLRQPLPDAPSATLKPADAQIDDYRLLQKRIGTTRNVVVQPSTYGTENAPRWTRIARSGRRRAASPSSTRA